jgi:DNA-directed RNA polymerase subunit RPC12/RpoP
MINYSLKYFCVKCGSELFSKTTIKGLETFSSSQECLKCGYMLLFGTIKKKT